MIEKLNQSPKFLLFRMKKTNPCSEHNQSNEQQATSASLIIFPLQLRFSSHAFNSIFKENPKLIPYGINFYS